MTDLRERVARAICEAACDVTLLSEHWVDEADAAIAEAYRGCCATCRTPLDIPGRPWTRSCGGDCLACMADAGDPECVEGMAGVGASQWRPISEVIEAAKADDGWIGPCLFGIQRSCGWETWVGQCDNGDIWLGRSGDGECWGTDVPTHWIPLPPAPAPALQTGEAE